MKNPKTLKTADICITERENSIVINVLRANGKLPASHSYACRSEVVSILFFVAVKVFYSVWRWICRMMKWTSKRVSEWVCVWMNRLIYFYRWTYFNFNFECKIHSIAIAFNIIVSVNLYSILRLSQFHNRLSTDTHISWSLSGTNLFAEQYSSLELRKIYFSYSPRIIIIIAIGCVLCACASFALALDFWLKNFNDMTTCKLLKLNVVRHTAYVCLRRRKHEKPIRISRIASNAQKM